MLDIAFSTVQSARHMAKPTTVHMAGVKRILRYLRGTPNPPIIYKKHNSYNLVGFCDASYGIGDHEKLNSVTGSMFFVAGGLVHFLRQLQKISAQSTTESAIIAVNSRAKQGFLPVGHPWRTRLLTLQDLQDFMGP